MVRPSYVLGGRAMEIVHEQRDLERYMRSGQGVSRFTSFTRSLLNDAIEVDVDCLSDGTRTFIGGVMEHIEQAGVHSGDSACSLPPYSLKQATIEELKRQTSLMAKRFERGWFDECPVRDSTKDGEDVVYVLEVNPRFTYRSLCVESYWFAVGKNCGAMHGWSVFDPQVFIKKSFLHTTA